MLTKNEVTTLNLSPTKKDFVQLWNELLDVAGKLSERWDPTSTNESDPGIVILKALTGIADKLNYNIDKNTLEAFMPTAAQEESMRKLCDMLGYNIKYYKSAVTDVTIRYHNTEPTADEEAALNSGLPISKFTPITNVDQTVHYFTINEKLVSLNTDIQRVTVPCMEGQLVKCESLNENGLITAEQITYNNRFYLPESQIAENGIFVYNATPLKNNPSTLVDGEPWKAVDNLNVKVRGSLVFKFGYDSYESRPYLEFPDDYSELFDLGLFIYYARTNGANGNISPRTLTQVELPSTDPWGKVSAGSISAENIFAANTGANIETIEQAYNNFKKTVGTFDTLVTCRDYMNKIYMLLDGDGKPYVSNIRVTDIRNDLNRAVTICSCDEGGIFYQERAVTGLVDTTVKKPEKVVLTEISATKPYFDQVTTSWHLGDSLGLSITAAADLLTGNRIDGDRLLSDATITAFSIDKPGDVSTVFVAGTDILSSSQVEEFVKLNPSQTVTGYWTIAQNGTVFQTKIKSHIITHSAESLAHEQVVTDRIDHFDLVLYPFKTYNQVKSNVKDIRAVYDASFTYNEAESGTIANLLESEGLHTAAHAFKRPESGDIVSINNYLRLNALISTNTKLTVDEGQLIIEKIKIDLANAFNLRELDFGEEIPFESILSVIENADSRIRIASLAEPALFTTYSVLHITDSGERQIHEYAVASDNWLTAEEAAQTKRFSYIDDNGDKISTFDTAEARKIYNKLVLRNVLAGRIPLFNYNEVFSTANSEGQYLCTTTEPSGTTTVCDEPDSQNPITIKYDGGNVIVKQLDPQRPDAQPIVSETTAPYNNLQTDSANPIQKISAFCNIETDPASGNVDVELTDGEYVKFRAPNFITKVTYPAYVNYRLELNAGLREEAKGAEGACLLNTLSRDLDQYSPAVGHAKICWEKVFDYFKAIDTGRCGDESLEPLIKEEYKDSIKESRFVKKFTVQQDVGEFTEADPENPTEPFDNFNGTILVKVPEATASTSKLEADDYLAKSGCVKILNPIHAETLGFCAYAKWKDGSAGDVLNGVNIVVLLDQDPEDPNKGTGNPFITDASIFSKIQGAVNEQLNNMVHQMYNGRPVLPTSGAWTVSFDFECVPFEAAAYPYWTNLIAGNTTTVESMLIAGENIAQEAQFEARTTISPPAGILEAGKTAVLDQDTVFWRLFGEGYAVGKYINATNSNSKYLPLSQRYLASLSSESLLSDIYVLWSLGRDSLPETITNGTEYQLQTGERLFIEYTPSTTNADGTTETAAAAVTEMYEEGTIIRPDGFTVGLIDSATKKASGVSYSKQDVVFKGNDGNIETVAMHSLGANEQIEIRDFARVEIGYDTLSALYMYKNFDCEILENFSESENGRRTYTLKDGEYVFYTDKDMTELAYYSNGTRVELYGNVVLPKADKIDIATIFDTGIQEIPWQYTAMVNKTDKIIFQEYQYVTLGAGDKLGKVMLLPKPGVEYSPVITADWTPCDFGVTYYLSTEPTSPVELPPVRLASADNLGCGWDICSVLELESSPSIGQTLRDTGKIHTGISLSKNMKDVEGDINIAPQTPVNALAIKDEKNHSLAFKTNVSCQANSDLVDINNIYSNTNKYSGFQVKIYADDPPVLVSTARHKVVPSTNKLFDYATWTGERLPEKAISDLWNTVELKKIRVGNDADPASVDNALRLSANILPDTYGIMCIYVSYTSNVPDAATWIEVLPGMSTSDYSIINAPENLWETGESVDNRTGLKNCAAKLFLHRGINCIRINKSGRFFVKTTTEQGTLYFDNMRLVNTQSTMLNIQKEAKEAVSAELPGSAEIPVTTMGFNLDRLHYLPVTNSAAEYDKEVKDKIAQAEQAELERCFGVANKRLESNATKQIISTLSNAKAIANNIRTDIHKIVGDLQAADETELQTKITNKAKEFREKLTAELSKIFSLDSLANMATLRRQLELSIEIGNKAVDILDTVDDTKLLVAKIEELSSSIDKILTEAEADQYLAELANARRSLLATEVAPDSDSDVATAGQKLIRTDTSACTTLVDLVQQKDTEAKHQCLADIITQLGAPVAHEDYNQIIAVLQDLSTSGLLSTPNETQANSLVNFEAALGHQAPTRLLAALDTLESYLRSEVVIVANVGEDGQPDGTESDNTPQAIKDALERVAACRTALIAQSAGWTTGLANSLDVFNVLSTTGTADTLLTGLQTIAQKERLFAEKELERIKSLITKFETVAASAYFFDYTAELVTFINAPESTLKAELVARFADLCREAELPLESKNAADRAKLLEEYSKLEKALVLNNSAAFETCIESMTLLPGVFEPISATGAIMAKYNAHAVIANSLLSTVISVKDGLASPTRLSSTLAATLGEIASTSTEPLYEVIKKIKDLLEAAAAGDDVDSTKYNQAFAYKDQLQQYINVEKDLQAQLEQGLYSAVSTTFADALEVNGSTALVENTRLFINTITESTVLETELQAVLESTIAAELDLSKTLQTFIGFDNMITNDNHLTLLNWFGTATTPGIKQQYDTAAEWTQDSGDLKSPLVCWPTLPDLLAACRKLIDVGDIVQKAYIDLNTITSTTVTTDALEKLAAVKAEIIDNSAYSFMLPVLYTLETTIRDIDIELDTLPDKLDSVIRTYYIEQQLLHDIREIDINRDFYYNAKLEDSFAIDLNESKKELNSLMNPATNYDVNNINNNFVISKLDIDHLTSGLQLARSSRL